MPVKKSKLAAEKSKSSGNGSTNLTLNYRERFLNAYLTRTELFKSLLDIGKRDIDAECGYPSTVSIEAYVQMYRRVGIARRVVNVLPEESWTTDPAIYETEESEDSAFEIAWEELEQRMSVYHWLHRVDEISGIGRFGILLLGLDDGADLSKPVSKSGQRQLLYIRAFDESAVDVISRETRSTDPRYGHPILYQIKFNDTTDSNGTGQGESINVNVHWTRVIHVADNRRGSEVYGVPRMEDVWNNLLDIRKLLGGSAEMFWKGAFPGFSFELHPDAVLSETEIDKEAVRKEFQAYMDGLQRYMAFEGLTAKPLAPQVADPSGHLDAQLTAIAITKAIPKRILFGSEQSQLASQQDTRTWHRRVARRQSKYLTPMLVRPFVDRMIEYGVVPAPESGQYKVKWEDLAAPSDLDKATVASKFAEALARYASGGVDQFISIRSFLLHFIGLDSEVIDAIEEEAKTLIQEEENMVSDDLESGDEVASSDSSSEEDEK